MKLNKLMLGVFALGCTSAFAQSPCDGKIQDKLNHPMVAGQVAKPAAGQAVIDPQFGTKITRITNANPADGTNAVIIDLYNSMRGWNADSSQIIAWNRKLSRGYEFYLGDDPYTHLGTINFTSAFPSDNTWPADIEHIIWDSSDPNVLYYPAYDGKSSRSHPLLMKVTTHWPAAPTQTMVRDFQAECAAHGVQPGTAGLMNVLSLGHGQDMSYDGQRLVGLRCGNPNVPGGSWDFVYSITSNTILGPGYAALDSYDSPPWPCPSGACTWRQRNGFIYDTNLNQIGTTVMVKSLEHSTVGYTIGDGSHPAFDFVAQAAFDEVPAGSLLIWRLDQATSKPTTIVGQANGWPYTLHGTHPSLSAKNGSGWVSVGMVGSGYGDTGVLDNEIILANVNTGAVCRIAHARTRDDANSAPRPPDTVKWSYWGETHPQISNDGYRILFNSDWENSSSVDMYVADLRPFATTILTPVFPNAVKSETYHVPVSIGGGQPPYTLSQPIGTFPAGIHLAGLALDGPSTGVETQTFTLHACDSASPQACNDRSYSLTSQERPVITTTSPLPDQIVGMPVTLAPLTATGGVPPYTWSLTGPLCAGMTLNTNGSWTVGPPITLQTCNFSVSALDSSASPIAGTKNFSLTVKMPPAGGCPCAPSGLSVKVEVIP